MSTAVLDANPSASSSSSRGSEGRRKLFKPSTWTSKRRSVAFSPTDEGRAEEEEEEIATNAPLDAVETGAPLTALVSPPHPHPHQESGSATPAGGRVSPPPLSSAPALVFTPDAHGRISFFSLSDANYALSNSAPYPVYYNGVKYATAEHLFHSLKFPSHPEISLKIRRAKTPLEAIRIARSHTPLYPEGWFNDALNVRVMQRVVLAKFSQHESLREALLATEEAEIVNASPTDVFWGEGGEGRGRNVLGKVIGSVREVLRLNEGVRVGSGAKTM